MVGHGRKGVRNKLRSKREEGRWICVCCKVTQHGAATLNEPFIMHSRSDVQKKQDRVESHLFFVGRLKSAVSQKRL